MRGLSIGAEPSQPDGACGAPTRADNLRGWTTSAGAAIVAGHVEALPDRRRADRRALRRRDHGLDAAHRQPARRRGLPQAQPDPHAEGPDHVDLQRRPQDLPDPRLRQTLRLQEQRRTRSRGAQRHDAAGALRPRTGTDLGALDPARSARLDHGARRAGLLPGEDQLRLHDRQPAARPRRGRDDGRRGRQEGAARASSSTASSTSRSRASSASSTSSAASTSTSTTTTSTKTSARPKRTTPTSTCSRATRSSATKTRSTTCATATTTRTSCASRASRTSCATCASRSPRNSARSTRSRKPSGARSARTSRPRPRSCWSSRS